jgi:hypothetical protein
MVEHFRGRGGAFEYIADILEGTGEKADPEQVAALRKQGGAGLYLADLLEGGVIRSGPLMAEDED